MHNILEAYMLSAKQGTAYNCDRKKYSEAKEAMICTNNLVTQIIADAIEDRQSER